MVTMVKDKAIGALEEEGLLDDDAPPAVLSVSLQQFGLDGVVVDGLLTAEECRRILERAEGTGGFSFWDEAGRSEKSERHRNADTFECVNVGLAERLFERLRPFVPADCLVEADDDKYERVLFGDWRARTMNPHFLINRYASGGHFAPHIDGSVELNFDERTLYTVLIYLNDCEQGGGTQLLRRVAQGSATRVAEDGAQLAVPSSVVHTVEARTGRALMYWHDTMHAGERVGAGCEKYCVRSDVVYERVPRACVLPHDQKGYELYKKYVELEVSGQVMEAGKYLPLICRTSETVAIAYGLMEENERRPSEQRDDFVDYRCGHLGA